MCTEYYFDVKTDIGVVLLTNGDCNQVDGYEAAMDSITNRLFDTFESADDKLSRGVGSEGGGHQDGEASRNSRSRPRAAGGGDLCDF